MTEMFMLRALLFAGECFAASVLLLGFAAIITRFLKNASVRHLAWLTAFGTILLLPAAALMIPPQITVHRPAAVEQPEPAAASSEFDSTALLPVAPPATAPSWNITASDIALALFGLWLFGFGWNALRLLIGAIGVNALQMSSARIESDDLEFVKPQRCDLRLASERTGPMTWGTLRPVILLPNGALSWPPHRLRAVLLHELAHVRRCDSFAQTVSRIACTLYWLNPLAWIGLRALRRDAEIAADDLVIGAGLRPSAYAGELLKLASECRHTSPALAGLSMASESALAARVKSILSPDQFRRGVTSMDVVKIVSAGVVAAAALALVRPSLAEEAPPEQAIRNVAAVAAVPAVPPVPVIFAAYDVPPAPPSPPAPEGPPAPPAPPAITAPPLPPEPAMHHHHHLHLHSAIQQAMREMHMAMHEMQPEDREKMHEILRNAHHEMQQAMLKARPEMERAMAEARAHRDDMKKLRPQIREAMREAAPDIERAMWKAHDALEKAHVDARVRRHVDEAMRSVQMHMDERRAMEDSEHDREAHEMDRKNSEQDEDQEDSND